MSDIIADMRNMRFMLYEVFDAEALTKHTVYEDHSKETFDMALDTADQVAREVFLPAYQEFDKQNARVEIVDLFHFLISLAQTAGLTADGVFAAYMKKNEVNFARQDSGYTVKDESDNKDI